MKYLELYVFGETAFEDYWVRTAFEVYSDKNNLSEIKKYNLYFKDLDVAISSAKEVLSILESGADKKHCLYYSSNISVENIYKDAWAVQLEYSYELNEFEDKLEKTDIVVDGVVYTNTKTIRVLTGNRLVTERYVITIFKKPLYIIGDD